MKIGILIGGAFTALLGYAFYFDYKRRNDPLFRKALKLKKLEAKRIKEEELKKAEEKTVQLLTSALELVKSVKYPNTAEERETFFTENLQNGEMLMKTTPDKLDEIAACFFNAVKVYPNPVDLLVILQKSLPEDIIALVYAMISTEDQKVAQVYYEELTGKYPAISIKQVDNKSRGLFANAPMKQNDVILIEDPVITCLNVPAIKQRNRCHYCLSQIPHDVLGDPDHMVVCEDGYTVFQSSTCHQRALTDYLKSFQVKSEGSAEYAALVRYCVDQGVMYPLMVSKFIAKMITKQLSDTRKSKGAANIAPEWEHLERLPMADISNMKNQNLEKERDLICDALGGVAPGIAEFLTADRYFTIKAAIVGNSIGIHSNDDESTYEGAFEGQVRPRTIVSHEKVHSAGLYFIASYIRHDNEPNAVIEFGYPHASKSKKSNIPSPKLFVKSLRPIEEGEEITISHLPVQKSYAQVAASGIESTVSSSTLAETESKVSLHK